MATHRRNNRPLTTLVMAAIVALAGSSSQAAVTIEQSPLFIGSGVPGNLMLVPSVEFPTIISQANLGAFDASRAYAGYFDSLKCYAYSYSVTEADRHFYPVSIVTLAGTCPDASPWHGNYLNWAATQTIDPFRKALTGGLRVRDTATETWIEKARYDRSALNYFPHRDITAAQATPATPFTGRVVTCINDRGSRMSISSADSCNNSNPGVDYNPAVHGAALVDGQNALTYNVSVRVKVCDSSVGVESNCVRYSQGWKPEGLIQEYAADIRYGVFGYLNDDSMTRDGGVLRARLKFVAPDEYLPGRDPSPNALNEWNRTTGVLIRNPNPTDAANTGGGVQDSGVINYINKFGQMTTDNHKDFDPVSEMYYAALRYLRFAGNVASYSNIAQTGTARYSIADGFPVITDWEDPMVVQDGNEPLPLYCAKNAMLGGIL